MLANFPRPPPPGTLTVCERNAELITSHPSSHSSQPTYYPDLNLAADIRRTFRSNETARSAFLEHDDSSRSRLLEAWYEHGLSGVLEHLSREDQPLQNKLLQFLTGVLRQSLWFVRAASNWHSSKFPHLAMSNDRLTEKFSSNAIWSTGLVRCFAWHPHAAKFAVALHDDSVCIHHAHPTDIIPVLKHKMQKGVADLAWKPMSASVLAVACQNCILLWTVDPMSLSTRPSTSCVQILSRPGHCPVISLAWCPLDGVLVSASPTDNAIIVWGTTMDSCVPIKRAGHGGVTLLKWSPEGSKLFTACPSPLFRVWQCTDWMSERWTKLTGRCQAACWSPDGCTLLFATSEEPLIYGIMFHDGTSPSTVNDALLGITQSARPVIDTSTVEHLIDDITSVCVGGIVQTMTWDPNGERLAVLCQGSSATFVALFQTRLGPTFELLPSGFIRGLSQEIATIISFKPKFDEGSLLTVVWSSGRISHIPLYYAPRHLISRSHDTPFQKHLRSTTFAS